MAVISKKKKGKVRWSNLYSFSCFKPSTLEPSAAQELIGQPGFSRVVFCNEPHLHRKKPYKYPYNNISTTKYNFLTFLPRALFEQFRRVANFYFLLGAVLSLVSLAPFSRASLIAPLVFVVGISMLKEAVEDWHRFLQDLDVNNRTVKAHDSNGVFVNKLWKELRVGDVVKMEFRKCSIAGVSYGGAVTEVDLAASRRINVDFEACDDLSTDEFDQISQSYEVFEFSVSDFSTQKAVLGREVTDNTNKGNPRLTKAEHKSVIKGFNFRDDRLMNKNWIHGSNLSDITMFFRVMALCHTGIPLEDDKTNKLRYEAESPEEVAFLIASQEFGFQFCRRTQSVIVLKEFDPYSNMEVEREYKLLNLLEFSSSRKRMSVIVCNEEGQILLLCKGADSIIFDRLADNGRTYEQATTSHLSNYAQDGFRTLAFAYRTIEAAEYERWNTIFTQAKTTIGHEREQLLEEASEMIEKDLMLLGVVAVEDKLQKGVPECIDKLAQAGFKIWLLTGDKRETAINIGFACSLLRQDMKQFHLTLSREAESKKQVKAMKKDILHQIESSLRVMSNKEAPFALVVDGKALEIALEGDVKDKFLQLAVNCASVICCRVSPKQKALITRLVKQYTGRTTLAIGDGANDVGMIQEADIGVGISGMEGMQAVMASDFSLPQFRFLERLLIVHGHWCYQRIAKMVLYFVYKNVAFGLTLFYYELYTSFSGEVLYDDWYMTMFNVMLTSLPVIALGVLEQDVSSDVCLQVK
ncbi:Cation-transporting P-type ATPase [Corchorus olitorius]|uniref:Phospholipid-transporting ATPase n=1 Tax=Corchorus olitorius TaxID=93759 RepID=A0A1R3H6G1_9ROSI|nr:Cation-transporting P-type ATPase [Corchorus olitorius]